MTTDNWTPPKRGFQRRKKNRGGSLSRPPPKSDSLPMNLGGAAYWTSTMTCTHDIIAKDNACADGMCPICLADENKRLTAYNKIAHTEIDQMIVERSALKTKAEKLQILLNEARGPEGELPERVAEWLRGKGYTVTKNETEVRFFGEIPL
jgi:hypothetical protein